MKLLFFLGCFALTAAAETQLSKERVVFDTSLGNLVFALYPQNAPKTVAQFKKLVERGVYNSTHFFRVHPKFVAQVTDANGRSLPLTNAQRALIHPIDLEPGRVSHTFGVLSMAHYDDPHSGEVSFSILLGDAPHLDGKFTVFGEVVSGQEVLAKMQQVPRDNTTPTVRIEVRRAVLVDDDQKVAGVLAQSEPVREPASVAVSAAHPVMGWALVIICVLGALVNLFAARLTPSMTVGLHLVQMLIGLFALTVAYGPLTPQSTLLGGALCLAWLCSFRLFSRFESR